MAMKKATEAAQAEKSVQADISPSDRKKTGNGGNTAAVGAGTEVTYTVAEYAKAASTVFDRPCSPDIVTAAFRMAGKQEATKKEAAIILSKFLKKEVKVR